MKEKKKKKKRNNTFRGNLIWLISKWWFWIFIVIWLIIFILSLTYFIPSTNNDWIIWLEFLFSSIIAIFSFSIAIIISENSKEDLDSNSNQTNEISEILKIIRPKIEETNEKMNKWSLENSLRKQIANKINLKNQDEEIENSNYEIEKIINKTN